MGVDVRTSTKVIDVDATGIVVEDSDGERQRIEAKCKVWAAGVAASPLAGMLAEQAGVEVDRAGRIPVEPDLSLPGYPEVFVVGDMMALDNLPGVAQVAIQGARYAARTITDRLDGRPPRPAFSYRDKGSMATISRFSAVMSSGPIRLSGFLAWLAWLGLHILYIVGFKHRVTTLLHWPSVSSDAAARSAPTRCNRCWAAVHCNEFQLTRRRSSRRLPSPEAVNDLQRGAIRSAPSIRMTSPLR